MDTTKQISESLSLSQPYSNQLQTDEYHSVFRNELTRVRSIEDAMVIRYNVVDKLFQKNSDLIKGKSLQEIKDLLKAIADFIEMRDVQP